MYSNILTLLSAEEKKIRQTNYANLARRMGVDFNIYQNLVMLEWPELSERKREKKQQTKKKKRPNPTMRDRAGILLTIIPVVYFVLVGTRSV